MITWSSWWLMHNGIVGRIMIWPKNNCSFSWECLSFARGCRYNSKCFLWSFNLWGMQAWVLLVDGGWEWLSPIKFGGSFQPWSALPEQPDLNSKLWIRIKGLALCSSLNFQPLRCTFCWATLPSCCLEWKFPGNMILHWGINLWCNSGRKLPGLSKWTMEFRSFWSIGFWGCEDTSS